MALGARVAALVAALAGCAAPVATREPAMVGLPLHRGWFEGREVRYVTTDVSDRQVAAEQGANHVPSLAAAAGPGAPRGLLSRVYKVMETDQRPVFQSIPSPVGPGSQATSYSPLWRLVKVTWRAGAPRRELRSEEAILAAEERGEVRIQPTTVILNCPVLEVDGLGRLPGIVLP